MRTMTYTESRAKYAETLDKVVDDREEVIVTRASIREYLATQRVRYRLASRAGRRRLLDEVVAVTGYHRKAVIRCLRDTPRPRVSGAPVGRPRQYGPAVAVAAQVLWEAAGQIGAKRLQPFVPELLARLTACGELALSPATTALVQRVSPATLERLLTAARRDRPRRGLSTTQPGAWLKQQIPIRTFAEWDDANADFRRFRNELPTGTTIRAFAVAVEEVMNAYEGMEGQAV